MIQMQTIRKSKGLFNKPVYTGEKIAKYFGFIYDNTWSSVFHITRTFFLLSSGMLHYIFEVIYNYDKHNNLTFVELTYNITVYVYAIAMIYAVMSKSQKFKTFGTELKKLIKHEVDKNIELTPNQKKVKEDTNDFIKQYIKLSFIAFSWALTIVVGRRPFLERTSSMVLPHEGWVPFEVNTWPRYFVVCLFQIITSTNLCYVHWYLLVNYVIQSKQLCGQFEVLSVFIKETFDYVQVIEIKSSKETIVNHEQYMQDRLTYIIKCHHILLRCFDLFLKTYSIFLFTVGFNSVLITCISIYMITDPNSTFSLILEFVHLLIPILFITGCYCWFSQQITDWWSEIRETIYDTTWYMESITTQKAILNIMTACTKNKLITGGGLQEFSLKGFSELLQASFSYFNMLKAVR